MIYESSRSMRKVITFSPKRWTMDATFLGQIWTMREHYLLSIGRAECDFVCLSTDDRCTPAVLVVLVLIKAGLENVPIQLLYFNCVPKLTYRI